MTARQAGADSGRSVRRVRQPHVEWVRDRLGDRDWKILQTLVRLRLASSLQLERLHFRDLSPSVRGRIRRRVLARLVAWRVLLTLERRIGGVRAGSAGLVFALDSAGQQLANEASQSNSAVGVRRPREPSVVLLGHSLAASELYVSLVELSRAHGFTIADYRTEPACWLPLPLGGWLKPDAYLKLSTAGYDDHWWVEIDKGSEHLPVIRRKLLAYLDYANGGGLGPGDVLPRLLITVSNERRRNQVKEIIDRLPEPAGRLLHVVTEVRAADFLYEVLRE